jgi:2-dehydro-3-deoxy-D-gluconate 5-dehydrogenase
VDLFDLSGRVAIVTGGNGGIGRGIALGLAEAGADICIASRNQDKSARVQSEVEGLGRRCISIPCDVNEASDIVAVIDATRAAFGGFQILVNNAGIGSVNAADQMTDEEWSSVIDTNLSSVFGFCRAAYPTLAEKGGKIINIGSMYSLFGASLAVSYAASKGGVVQLTKSLAVSWAEKDIQVNAILPGWINTDMTAPVATALPEMHRMILERTPAGRFGDPEECAGAAVFLASGASDFVTGQSLAVCGGYSIS